MMRGVIVLQHLSEQCLQRVLLCTGARLAHTLQSVQLLHLSQKLVNPKLMPLSATGDQDMTAMLIINCNKLISGGDSFPPQKRHGAVGQNDAYTSKTRTEVITVLLRGQTGIALDGLVSTFWKCLNRLLDSLQTRKVLRGGGAFEVQAAMRLKGIAHEILAQNEHRTGARWYHGAQLPSQ